MRKRNLLLILAMLLLVFCLVQALGHQHKHRVIEEMNRQELHYDADGYFIMLDRTTGLLGFYNCCDPLGHEWVKDQVSQTISDGVYLAQYAQNGLYFFDRDGCLYDNDPLVLVLDENFRIPEGTPMLVYGS